MLLWRYALAHDINTLVLAFNDLLTLLNVHPVNLLKLDIHILFGAPSSVLSAPYSRWHKYDMKIIAIFVIVVRGDSIFFFFWHAFSNVKWMVNALMSKVHGKCPFCINIWCAHLQLYVVNTNNTQMPHTCARRLKFALHTRLRLFYIYNFDSTHFSLSQNIKHRTNQPWYAILFYY